MRVIGVELFTIHDNGQNLRSYLIENKSITQWENETNLTLFVFESMYQCPNHIKSRVRLIALFVIFVVSATRTNPNSKEERRMNDN